MSWHRAASRQPTGCARRPRLSEQSAIDSPMRSMRKTRHDHADSWSKNSRSRA
jgi:hypothetical protein